MESPGRQILVPSISQQQNVMRLTIDTKNFAASLVDETPGNEPDIDLENVDSQSGQVTPRIPSQATPQVTPKITSNITPKSNFLREQNAPINRNPTNLPTITRPITNRPITQRPITNRPITNMPWLTTPITTPKPKTTKKNATNHVNSIFEQCLTHVTDDFWRSILMEAAKGKFPRNFSFSKSILSFKKKTKSDTIEVPTTPYNATCVILDFLRNKGGIRSPLDLEREKREQEESMLAKSISNYTCWAKIKNKALKRAYITEFIKITSDKHKLNFEQRKKLKTLINSGFLLGSINANNIVFDGFSVTDITILDYDGTEFSLETDDKKTISFPNSNLPVNLKDVIKYKFDKVVNFETIWVKYTENFIQETKDMSNLEVPQTPGVINSNTNTERILRINTEVLHGASHGASHENQDNQISHIQIPFNSVSTLAHSIQSVTHVKLNSPLNAISYANSTYTYARTLYKDY